MKRVPDNLFTIDGDTIRWRELLDYLAEHRPDKWTLVGVMKPSAATQRASRINRGIAPKSSPYLTLAIRSGATVRARVRSRGHGSGLSDLHVKVTPPLTPYRPPATRRPDGLDGPDD